MYIRLTMKITPKHFKKIIMGVLVFFVILVMQWQFTVFSNSILLIQVPAMLINMSFNNFLLWNFRNQLFNYPLPKDTEIVKKESKIGLLQGNGNHCDFEAKLTLKSNNSPEKIVEHYSGMDIFSVFGGTNIYKRIEKIESGIFTITIGDSHYDSGMDFRCH